MSVDSYKIFISLSHRRIAFDYWQRDGEDKLVPMPSGTWPAPLAFYCSDSGIVIGEDAARAALNGTENAFDNYFDILVEDKTYTIGGRTKPVRDLLLDASERIFRDFYKEVLFNRNGTLNDNRANMPLTIVCEADIKANERAFLYGLFKDCGYARVNIVEYEQYISQYISTILSKDYACNKVVVAWTEGADLTFSLFDINGTAKPISATYEGLGVDPRKEYAIKLIWERICGQNPWMKFPKEKDTLSKLAEKFLSSSDPFVSDTVILSDNIEYRYELNRHQIDCESNTDGISVKEKLDEFLKLNGLTKSADVLLLLRGDAANNSYFETNLSYGFGKTIKSDKKLRNNVMKLLISQPIAVPEPTQERNVQPIEQHTVKVSATQPQFDHLKTANRRWRELRAAAKAKANNGFIDEASKIWMDFYAECEAIPGAGTLLAEIKAELDKLPKASAPQAQPKYEKPQEPQENPAKLKELARKWKVLRASAKGMLTVGKLSEATEILEAFAAELKRVAGAEDLLRQVESELVALSSSNQPKAVSTPTPTPTKKSPQAPVADEGTRLIQQGKLKEARDWFRTQCDTKMTQTLNNIIRSQRAVELRKSGIEECRKTKNRDQINRIIKELEDYVDLCQQAGVDASDYKKLTSEYKKIQ